MASTHLNFAAQPLIQVSAKFGLRREKDLPVCIPFVNDLHDLLRETFPDLGDLPQQELPPGAASAISFSMGQQLVGAVYGGGESSCVFILQRNMIAVRWLKELDRAYPKYRAEILPKMKLVSNAIQQLVGPEGFVPHVVAMEYLTFIDAEAPFDGKRVEELVGRLVPPIAADRSTLSNTAVVWRSPNEVELNVSVTLADPGTGPNGYVLRTAGGKILADPLKAVDELNVVHDELCAMFAKMVTKQANTEWQRQ